MSFIVLDVGTVATTARRRLAVAGAVDVVLIRRVELEGRVWHALDRRTVEDRLAEAPDEARLGSLLTLDRMNEVPESKITDPDPEGVEPGHERLA